MPVRIFAVLSGERDKLLERIDAYGLSGYKIISMEIRSLGSVSMESLVGCLTCPYFKIFGACPLVLIEKGGLSSLGFSLGFEIFESENFKSSV